MAVRGLRLRSARTTTAFNLTVDGIHTYFVGVGQMSALSAVRSLLSSSAVFETNASTVAQPSVEEGVG